MLVSAFELEFELEPEGRTDRRLPFSGEAGATFATELAVGWAKLKVKERRFCKGVGLVVLEVEVEASPASGAGFPGVKPRREQASDVTEMVR